jgi:hypothetical protein
VARAVVRAPALLCALAQEAVEWAPVSAAVRVVV